MSYKGPNSISRLLDYSLYDLPEEHPKNHGFLGQGKKNVMVIAKEDDAGNDIEFLQSVFSPLGINYPEDVFILITPDPQVSFAWLCQNYDFDKLVLFGVDTKVIGLQISVPLYRPINIAKKRLIFADNVDVFASEKAKGGARPKARQLWMALQSFFENSHE